MYRFDTSLAAATTTYVKMRLKTRRVTSKSFATGSGNKKFTNVSARFSFATWRQIRVPTYFWVNSSVWLLSVLQLPLSRYVFKVDRSTAQQFNRLATRTMWHSNTLADECEVRNPVEFIKRHNCVVSVQPLVSAGALFSSAFKQMMRYKAAAAAAACSSRTFVDSCESWRPQAATSLKGADGAERRNRGCIRLRFNVWPGHRSGQGTGRTECDRWLAGSARAQRISLASAQFPIVH